MHTTILKPGMLCAWAAGPFVLTTSDFIFHNRATRLSVPSRQKLLVNANGSVLENVIFLNIAKTRGGIPLQSLPQCLLTLSEVQARKVSPEVEYDVIVNPENHFF